jgi:carbamoyltransferase
MLKNYVGLACTFHDPALAIVNSQGEVVFAEACERPYQTKRGFHCAADSFSFIGPLLDRCREPGAEWVVAKSWTPAFAYQVRRFAWLCKLLSFFTPRHSHLAQVLAVRGCQGRSMYHAIGLASEGTWMALLEEARKKPTESGGYVLPRRTVAGFDHHLTHAAAGCFSSPFREAVCAIFDGYGEWTTTRFYHYRDGRLRPVRGQRRTLFSLGRFYAAVCFSCGFDPLKGEEWKVMGLAPYGRHDPDLYRKMRAVVEVKDLHMAWRGSKRWASLLGTMPRAEPADLAFTGQQVFEEWMQEVLGNLYRRGLSENLVLGGGCALNSSFNGLVLDRTPFQNLYVYPAPADDGNAVGAALLAYYRDHPDQRPTPGVASPYLGSSLSREALKNLARFDRGGKVTAHPGAIHRVAARALAEGKIIGWAQGRAEFGPRALGNRSILADPRRPEMKDEINARVKFREEFRPFAPSILHEHGPAYFEHYQESPYMERTLRFRDDAAARVPAVVHVNQTGRLQTVRREWNDKYHALIEEFYRLTGIPMVLNTSFNVMGKPIIHSVEDALAVLHTTGLDAVALEDYWVEK